MRQELSSGRARSARIVGILAAFLAVVLTAPGHAAADHYARSLTPQALSPSRTTAAAPVQWCGNDVATGDRRPDAVTGNQLHVVYAYPADRPNRLPELASGIATDLAAIDEWWRRHDPLRAPRWDTFPFPGCAPGFGQLDIAAVKLARPASAYDLTDTGEVAQATYTDFVAAYGKLSGGKKYLVLWDAPVPRIDACAFSVEAVSVFWYLLDPPMPGCPPVDPGAQTYAAMVTAHELVHNLGASRPLAPHNCEGGHVCDDARDVLYGIPTLITLEQSVLDVGNDDYYGHSGSWTDVQDSPYLLRTDRGRQPVSVAVDPAVGGNVWTEEPGIGCPSTCSVEWESGSRATFRTQAQPGYRFAGWSGGCTGRLTRCERTIAGAFSVTARFTKLASSGGGTSPGTGGTANRAPRALFGRFSKFLFETHETVPFTSASTDRDGTVKTVEWDFGDGKTATGPTTSHVYENAGRYKVVLRVTDDRGAVARATRSLSIKSDPPRVYAFRGFGRVGKSATLRYSVWDQTGVARVRIQVYVGRRVVVRRVIAPGGDRSPRGSLKWRVRRTRAPLKWCVQARDVFGHVTLACSPIRVF